MRNRESLVFYYLLPFSRRKISWSLIPVLSIILEFHVEELFSKTQKQSEVVFGVVLNGRQ